MIFNSEQVSCKSFKIVTIASEGAWTLCLMSTTSPFPAVKWYDNNHPRNVKDITREKYTIIYKAL